MDQADQQDMQTQITTDTILMRVAPTLRKRQLQVPTDRRDLPPVPGPGIGATLLAPQVCVTRARGRGWAGLPSLSQLCDPEDVTTSECQFSLLQGGMVSWTLLRGQEDKTRNEEAAGSTLRQCKTNHSGRTSHRLARPSPGGALLPSPPSQKERLPLEWYCFRKKPFGSTRDCTLLCCKYCKCTEARVAV